MFCHICHIVMAQLSVFLLIYTQFIWIKQFRVGKSCMGNEIKEL